MEDVASLFGIHRNTVRQWIKQGLPLCDRQRPLLILGSELIAFLTAKRTRNKRPCKPGEVYCLPCRSPQIPALGMAEYRPLTATGGNLIGLCPACERLMYRRVTLAKLGEVKGNLDLTFTNAAQHIDERSKPSVNSDFKAGA